MGYKDQQNLYAYVGNDPINATDPTGLVEREIERKVTVTGSRIPQKMKVTVEAGDLSQEETEQLMGSLGDNFFIDQNGQNLSGFQKNVTGSDKSLVDKAQVAAQVVGAQLSKWGRGGSGLWDAWSSVNEIKADGRENPSALATTNNCLFGPGWRDRGVMTLYAGAFDGRGDKWSSSTTIFKVMMHESLHLHRDYPLGPTDAGYNTMHDALDRRARAMSNLLGFWKWR